MTSTRETNRSDRRRILALDGGGIRCLIAIELLAALEQRLAERHGDPNLRLYQRFDLVAGTSGGAIVAAAVALGLPMREIRDFVLRNAREMFRPAAWYRRLQSVYEKEALANAMKTWFGAETTLGSDGLRTLVLFVMSNWSTGSPWLLSNCPRAPFNARHLDDCNLHLKLWQLALASAAAPYYYEPETLQFGREKSYEFVFIDGGLTGFLNPAFKAFLYATTEPYGVGWSVGEHQLSVISIGSGEAKPSRTIEVASSPSLYTLVPTLPVDVLQATIREQDLLCRTFGRCITGAPIDLEIGDLKNAATACEPRLFRYHRVSPDLSPGGLDKLGCGDIQSEDVKKIDAVEHVEALSRIGRALAERSLDALVADA